MPITCPYSEAQRKDANHLSVLRSTEEGCQSPVRTPKHRGSMPISCPYSEAQKKHANQLSLLRSTEEGCQSAVSTPKCRRRMPISCPYSEGQRKDANQLSVLRSAEEGCQHRRRMPISCPYSEAQRKDANQLSLLRRTEEGCQSAVLTPKRRRRMPAQKKDANPLSVLRSTEEEKKHERLPKLLVQLPDWPLENKMRVQYYVLAPSVSCFLFIVIEVIPTIEAGVLPQRSNPGVAAVELLGDSDRKERDDLQLRLQENFPGDGIFLNWKQLAKLTKGVALRAELAALESQLAKVVCYASLQVSLQLLMQSSHAPFRITVTLVISSALLVATGVFTFKSVVADQVPLSKRIYSCSGRGDEAHFDLIGAMTFTILTLCHTLVGVLNYFEEVPGFEFSRKPSEEIGLISTDLPRPGDFLSSQSPEEESRKIVAPFFLGFFSALGAALYGIELYFRYLHY
ncbi:unnamed protein product [Cyprideis torosa]|uniref:Uncharacterized protein n=1 Tax=Cyprideis torosa TaxID=163714 RepID=A0A7R8WIR6_9CRUS|nr:unnamed protein product [Cyprideis torosa]CAG0901109.1 unnamed protein product [Cyprideis torosa]